jgi:hypothetical protein
MIKKRPIKINATIEFDFEDLLWNVRLDRRDKMNKTIEESVRYYFEEITKIGFYKVNIDIKELVKNIEKILDKA